MAYKLEKIGNYIVITNTVTGLTDEYAARDVLYVDTPSIVRISTITNSLISKDYLYADILDEDGNSFASNDAIIKWLRDNTGGDVNGAIPYAVAIAQGSLRGHSTLVKFGTRTAVAAATSSVIWEGNTPLYTYMSTAQQLKVVSSSTSDAPDGTGARTILLQGLDANFDLIEETITMNGTTTVTTTKSFLRVFRAYATTTGRSLVNVGKITIRNNAATEEKLVIVAGDGQSLMTIWTVPRGKTAYLVSAGFSTDTNKGARVSFLTRENNGATNPPYQIKYRSFVFSGQNNYPFAIPLKITEKTDIEVRVNTPSNAGITSAGATLEIFYKDND